MQTISRSSNSPELLAPQIAGLHADMRIAWTPEQHPVIRYINANGFNNHTAWVGIARNPRLNNFVCLLGHLVP
jgi:hypothetical protein